MIFSERYEMCDADSVALTYASSTAVTVVSEDIIDFGANGADAWGTGLGRDISGSVWNVSVNTVMVGASGVITAQFVSKAADASISSGATVHATVSFPAASVAGVTRSVKFPGNTVVNRYAGVLFTNVGGAVTSSKFDSMLNIDVEAIG